MEKVACGKDEVEHPSTRSLNEINKVVHCWRI